MEQFYTVVEASENTESIVIYEDSEDQGIDIFEIFARKSSPNMEEMNSGSDTSMDTGDDSEEDTFNYQNSNETR